MPHYDQTLPETYPEDALAAVAVHKTDKLRKDYRKRDYQAAKTGVDYTNIVYTDDGIKNGFGKDIPMTKEEIETVNPTFGDRDYGEFERVNLRANRFDDSRSASDTVEVPEDDTDNVEEVIDDQDEETI